eukprot:2208293-Ditylum_brightwellii.AAC.1
MAVKTEEPAVETLIVPDNKKHKKTKIQNEDCTIESSMEECREDNNIGPRPGTISPSIFP